MIRRPPRSTLSSSSAASDVYKRQPHDWSGDLRLPLCSIPNFRLRRVNSGGNQCYATDFVFIRFVHVVSGRLSSRQRLRCSWPQRYSHRQRMRRRASVQTPLVRVPCSPTSVRRRDSRIPKRIHRAQTTGRAGHLLRIRVPSFWCMEPGNRHIRPGRALRLSLIHI